MIVVPMIDIELAKEKARTGDCEGAIEMARAIVEDEFVTGEMIFRERLWQLWSNHCCSAEPTPMSRKPRLRSSGWQPCRPSLASCCTAWRC